MNGIFETLARKPLAEKMRPKKLSDIAGQRHLIGDGKPLAKLIGLDSIPSMILWGPPGSGKTTLAKIVANTTKARFHYLSAVLSGVADLRKIIASAKSERALGKNNILFIDEIHRWNKAQQDALLPHMEDGTITLIGSTTENPSFELVSPLLSRAKVYVLQPLSSEDISQIVMAAMNDERGLKNTNLSIDEDAVKFIVMVSDGDARRALNTLEIAANLATGDNVKNITQLMVENAAQQKTIAYDKNGEEHYNLTSAFIKSMRGSDPDAALYYMARMLEGGEDPIFISRRMIIFASEDIGNADPHAIQIAISCAEAFRTVGIPEGWIPLAQCATYLACAPKSNASYMAYKLAIKDVREKGPLSVPKKIRNASTKLLRDLGYAEEYKYPHDFEGHHLSGETYLPNELKDARYYKPTNQGYEKIISQRLKEWKK